MKKVFLGLLVAGVALGASAFTNLVPTTYYVTGYATINSPNDAYSFSTTPVTCPSTGVIPCEFHTNDGTLASPQLKSKIEGQVGLSIDDTRSSL
ncbi:hypothetical protein DBR11_22255 [Pedobacter sp. HMWF019]|uniref:hypothetical protein n=1 Tax=Pedobacter sp. HMWF019 TaxID=2056856 RepID=UPI000D3A94F9|nr:hypothetical protein [Pedobacter sp. HMWF019]PTS94927.1 hypothetical protein DBR11_22255 [Pedobacter sp. HMWF019]